MNKGLGIGAMVVAILAIFVPVVTIYVVWLALALAILAALMGDRVFPIVTVLISAINLFFFSPMTWALMAGENQEGKSFFFYMTVAMMIAPIAAMIMSAAKPTNEITEGEVQ